MMDVDQQLQILFALHRSELHEARQAALREVRDWLVARQVDPVVIIYVQDLIQKES